MRVGDVGVSMLNIFIVLAYGLVCFVFGCMFATDRNARTIIKLQKAIIKNLEAIKKLKEKMNEGANDERKAD